MHAKLEGLYKKFEAIYRRSLYGRTEKHRWMMALEDWVWTPLV